MAKTVTLGLANPPTVKNLGGENGLYLPQRPHGQKLLKNVRWSPLNTKMAKTVTLGSANPLTVTNLGGEAQKLPLFTPKTAGTKIAQKRPLEFTERKNDEDNNFRFG